MEMRLLTTLLVCCYVITTASGSPVGCSSRYPEIHYMDEARNIRLKNAKTEKYVFMKVEGDGVVFGTKVLTTTEEYEVEFTFYTYRTAEKQGGVVVLPTSNDSRVFSVTDDGHLEVPVLTNEYPESPNDLRRADSSFFRLKRAVDEAGNAIVLQAMDGCHYLAVDGDHLILKEYSGDSSEYPQEIVFYASGVSPSQTTST